MKEMVGGCCVCSDDRGWAENPLVYCDGPGCTVAVHQACYGIVTVPTGNWYCRKCESPDRTAKVRCELCPNKEGALKPTDNSAWAHVVCALYIPEVRFGNVTTMEPIILAQIPPERFNKTCYICEESNRGSGRSAIGACMQCNKTGCRVQFHVTCAQGHGLLCEEAGNYLDNVKYCGYCQYHYTKLVSRTKKGGNVKVIPPYRPIGSSEAPDSPQKDGGDPNKATTKRKLSTGSSGKGAAKDMDGPSTGPTDDDGRSSTSSDTMGGGSVSERESKPGSKKRKDSRTPGGSPASSPRPLTPTAVPERVPPSTSPPPMTSTTPPTTTPPAPSSDSVLKPVIVKEPTPRPNSIVVNVPLEVALPGGATVTTSPVPPTPTPPPSTTPIPTPPEPASVTGPLMQPVIPVKRARSQSSEKSDKSRRSKRSGSQAKPLNHKDHHHHHHLTNHESKSNRRHSSTSSHSTNHLSHQQPGGSASAGTTLMNHLTSATTIKDEKQDVKMVNSSSVNAPHMLGNALNPSSTMAQKMCDTLSQEIVAHSVFDGASGLLVGPQLSVHNRGAGSAIGSNNNNNNHNSTNNHHGWNSTIPQSLEQLLERQWEQGSQFLMEQAQHFDIASLLSCLHQLRAENVQLEDHVSNLVQRRDHLLAVNARLAIPLVSPVTNASTGGVTTTTATVTSAIVENGLPPSSSPHSLHHEPVVNSTRTSTIRSGSAAVVGNGSVLVRPSSESRRTSQSPATSYNSSLYRETAQLPSNPQVVMRRDVIEISQPSRNSTSNPNANS